MYIGVKFRDQGQIYYFWTDEEGVAQNDHVIVTTEEGQGMARVALVAPELPPSLPPEEVRSVDRKATEEDLVRQRENEDLRQRSFSYCRSRIKELELQMKLVDVEVRFDQSKLVFYFTAPARVDFRDLVKDLVHQFRARIELRQIGVRHEAQILGGIGNCGRTCCCHQFLRQFAPVTIKMAKEQQLFLNPSKISGVCGRLLCCLNFEKQAYADFYSRCPKIGKKYQTSQGEMKVLRANFFRDTLVVDAGEGEEREINLLEWAELFSEENGIQEQDPAEEDSEMEATASGDGDPADLVPDEEDGSVAQSSGQGQDQPSEKSGQSKKRGNRRSGSKGGRGSGGGGGKKGKPRGSQQKGKGKAQSKTKSQSER